MILIASALIRRDLQYGTTRKCDINVRQGKRYADTSCSQRLRSSKWPNLIHRS